MSKVREALRRLIDAWEEEKSTCVDDFDYVTCHQLVEQASHVLYQLTRGLEGTSNRLPVVVIPAGDTGG
jgi:hypothetical protein